MELSLCRSSSKYWANITEIVGFDRARETRAIRSGKFAKFTDYANFCQVLWNFLQAKLTESIKAFQNLFAPPHSLKQKSQIIPWKLDDLLLYTNNLAPRNNFKLIFQFKRRSYFELKFSEKNIYSNNFTITPSCSVEHLLVPASNVTLSFPPFFFLITVNPDKQTLFPKNLFPCSPQNRKHGRYLGRILPPQPTKPLSSKNPTPLDKSVLLTGH